MTKVTNHHTAGLNIAGVDIRPGATASVPSEDFKKWCMGNAAKIWLGQGIISADDKPAQAAAPATDPTERQQLEAQATELGVAFEADTSDEDLVNAIAEAEQEAGKTEREALLQEARSLGLNPNANTGVDKLRKMIEEKKAA